MNQPMIETVLGPVPADALGVVLPHEHFALYRGVTEAIEPPAGYLLMLETWERTLLREAQARGVRTLVEVTPIGMMRAVPMMQRLSRDTGMQVVACTGFYLAGKRPAWVAEQSADQLAARFVRELTEGMEGTSARAGIIKIAADSLTESEECQKVFRAAALASRETGYAITTHSCNFVQQHFDFLVEAGADPTRLYIGHADLVGDEAEYHHIATRGGHLIFTCWGIEHFVSQDLLASRIARLIEAGHAEAVLVSTDYAILIADNRMDVITSEYECPHRSHDFVLRYGLPRLRAAGVSDAALHQILVENPRQMLLRAAPAEPASAFVSATARSGLEAKTFSAETEADGIALVRAYTAGWRYSRPIDADLVAYWKTLGEHFQPQHMLLAYRDGVPRAFLHGEREGDVHHVHLLAMAPGAVEEGVWLLAQAEEQARTEGAARLCGPTCMSGRFYGGYVLGLEPYHPLWAEEGTQAFVQAGFHMTETEALMVATPPLARAEVAFPAGYEMAEVAHQPGYLSRGFRLVALCRGEEVAWCTGHLYPRLSAPGGGPVGQLGPVATDEAHQSKGLATTLVRLSLARLWDWGAAEVLISTGLQNHPALRAYEKAGFRRRYSQVEWQKSRR